MTAHQPKHNRIVSLYSKVKSNYLVFSHHCLFIPSVFLITFLVVLNLYTTGEQQFSQLANSFNHGRLHFISQSGNNWHDTVLWNGKYYWPLSPLPAVLLMPFVFLFDQFGLFFYQGYLNLFVITAIFIVLGKITGKIGYSANDTIYLVFAFCFASMLFATLSISSSWYFAHNVAVLLWLLFIYEFLTNSRRWTLGLLAGLLLATRTPAGLGAIFLITVNQITLANSNEERIKRAFRAIVATPIPVIVLLLLLYNFLRFGNPLEFGYSGGFQTLSDFLAKARDYGTFSLAHLPGNLYYALLSTPLPVFRDDISHVLAPPYLKANPWGISIFITSPYLFYLFTISYKDRISKIFLATTSLIALLVFTYYGIGFLQFGYRYALDFFPLLFVLLVKNYHQRHLNLSSTFKTVIIISAILNLIWILYLYNVDSVVNYINQNNCF